jgi:hypothetical protein
MKDLTELESQLTEKQKTFDYYWNRSERLWKLLVNKLIPPTNYKYVFPFFLEEVCPKCKGKIESKKLQKERQIYWYKHCIQCDYEVAQSGWDGTVHPWD